MGNVYNTTKAIDYKRFYTIADEDKKKIKDFFGNLFKELGGSKKIELLFLGVGTGRLELPLLESLVEKCSESLQEINITAIDDSEQMLEEFKKDYLKIDLHGIKINLKTIKKNIKEAAIFEDEKYDIITAFFVIHMLDQWVPVLKGIIKSLKKGGFFLSAEETGMAKIIDGMLPDNKLLDAKDEDFIAIWREFFSLRIAKGKLWFQPITASNYSFIHSIFDRLNFKKFCKTEIVFASQLEPFKKDDFKRWFTETALFHPIGKFLTHSEKECIFKGVDDVLTRSKDKFERNEKEGHKLTIFRKTTETLLPEDVEDAISDSLKGFLNDNMNLTLIDRSFTLKDLFEDIDLPEFESEKYLKAISNRLFILGVMLYNCFHERVHIDYIIWKPDYYYPEKSQYKHNLPAFIHMENKEKLCHYLSTYSFYFLARDMLGSDKTFIDFIFFRFKHFTHIVIKRGEKLNIYVEAKFDKTFRLIISLPEFEDSKSTGIADKIRQVCEEMKTRTQFEYGKILYNFNDIIGFAANFFNDRSKDEIKNKICELYETYKEKNYKRLKENIDIEFAKINMLMPRTKEESKVDDIDIGQLLKSLFCFNFIGIGDSETRWKKIRFYLGFIFSKGQDFEGFNILANIDFYDDNIVDTVVNIPSKIWSSKDGLYGSLQLIKEHVFTHALHSAISAIMSRNMSHNIGSHAIAQAINMVDVYEEKDYKNFLLYLQERMDFLALVSTTEANWGVKYNLQTLFDTFQQNKMLLDNIVKSEDKDIKIELDYLSKMHDILIPHGEAGKHAIYTILENFIRNSAKHQWVKLEKKDRPGNLMIKISCEDDINHPLIYRLTISSNLIGCNANVIKELNEKLSDEIIDKTGKLIQSNRGLKEQRISSCFLRLLPINKIEEYTPDKIYKHNYVQNTMKAPPLVTAVCIKNKQIEPPNMSICENDKCNFGIVLYLLKPMELLWIKKHDMSSEDIDELKSRGILVYRSVEEAEEDFSKTFPAKMVLFSKNAVDSDWLRDKDNLRRLPYRVMLEGGEEIKSKCVTINHIPSFDNCGMENYTSQLLEFLWKEWVEKFFKQSGKEIVVIHKALKDLLEPPLVYSDNLLSQCILNHDIENANPEGTEFFIPYSSTDDIGRLISQSDKHRYFRWEIAEMVYSRILIIDERVYDSKDIDKGGERIKEIWKRQGVDIIEHTQIIDRPGSILEKLIDNGVQYHFLIIHQGIIDKIIEKHDKKLFDAIWERIEANVPFPIVVSGRGKPETVTEGKGRWLQFADLEQHILQCADKPDAKYHLVQVLFALREEKEEKWQINTSY